MAVAPEGSDEYAAVQRFSFQVMAWSFVGFNAFFLLTLPVLRGLAPAWWAGLNKGNPQVGPQWLVGGRLINPSLVPLPGPSADAHGPRVVPAFGAGG